MKDQKTVVREFNELVNMTASELKNWLKSDESQSAGWPKDVEKDDGESVGHDSGRKIIEILESNPDKTLDKYSEDHIDHMRKVVAYCKRHLAQEEKTISNKSTEEAKQTKSYASLKNWGHDPLKEEKDDAANRDEANDGEANEDQMSDDGANGGDSNGDTGKAENGEADKQAGYKRKASDSKSGSNKRRETEKNDGGDADKDDEKTEQGEATGPDNTKSAEGKHTEEGHEDKKKNGHQNGSSKAKNGNKDEAEGKAENGPEAGETVSWNWGNGQPEGKVLDVKPEKATITTKNGNQASRNGNPEDPAVVIDTGKSKAVKQAHELN